MIREREHQEQLKEKTKIVLKNKKNFKRHEIKKYKKGLELLELVINSKDFKDEILRAKFTETQGMTNRQVYDYIMSGRNLYFTEVDKEIEIHVSMYYSFRRVIGYTKPSTWWTYLNRRMFRRMSADDIAGNAIHEYCHNLGFSHYKRKRTSVPYQVGNIVSRIGYRVLYGGELVGII